MKKPVLLITLLSVALGLAVASPAGAASPRQILKDCSTSPTGLLLGDYSKADLRKARDEMTGDVIEYTGCPDAISARLRARTSTNTGGDGTDGGGGTNGGGSGFDGGDTGGGDDWYDAGGDPTSGGGSTGSTGGGSSGGQLDGATGGTAPGSGTPAPPAVEEPGSAAAVELAGATVTPGIALDEEARPLPTPLIAFLVLLAIGAVGIGLPTIGRRVLARRRA